MDISPTSGQGHSSGNSSRHNMHALYVNCTESPASWWLSHCGHTNVQHFIASNLSQCHHLTV